MKNFYLMRKALFLFGIMACANICEAQQAAVSTDTLKTNRAQSVFVELGGAGLILSANYDTRFSNRRDGWGGRIGMGYIADKSFSIVTLPVQINYLFGKSNKFFELGIGPTYAAYNDKDDHQGFLEFKEGNTILGVVTLGYRYQPVESGFNFRAGFNTLFNDDFFIPFYGLSLGYTIK